MAIFTRNSKGESSVDHLFTNIRSLLEEKFDDLEMAFLARDKKREKTVLGQFCVDIHSIVKARLDSLQIAITTSIKKVFDLLLRKVLLWLLLLLLLLLLQQLANRPVGLPVLLLALASAVLGFHACATHLGLALVAQGCAATCANVALRLATGRSRSRSRSGLGATARAQKQGLELWLLEKLRK